ncbi:MAG: hypothetical protein ACQERJ_09095, partial [Bacillota bacterium]
RESMELAGDLKMGTEIITINRYLLEENLDSIDILNKLRCFVKQAKQIAPQLKEYQLYDVGFIAHKEFVLIKIYFYVL